MTAAETTPQRQTDDVSSDKQTTAVRDRRSMTPLPTNSPTNAAVINGPVHIQGNLVIGNYTDTHAHTDMPRATTNSTPPAPPAQSTPENWRSRRR